jgi:hypothetical protein
MVTERDVAILLALTRYYVLNRTQIQALVFPTDQQGRVTRRRLQALVDGRYINRQNAMVYHTEAGPPASVYFPSALGCEFLAGHFDDERYILTPCRSPISHHVQHWLAVSDTHICFDAAIAHQNEAKIDGWLNEWDVANKDEKDPENHYRLYTAVQTTPRVVCVPDAAFLLSMLGHKKIHYIEQDRATSGVEQVANQKYQGYAMMAEKKMHTRHFPEVTISTFSVLMIAPTPARRDLLRKAFRQKTGSSLWRFASVTDLVHTKILYEPIWYACDDAIPRALIKKDGN